jgi:hypothetical protein
LNTSDSPASITADANSGVPALKAPAKKGAVKAGVAGAKPARRGGGGSRKSGGRGGNALKEV